MTARSLEQYQRAILARGLQREPRAPGSHVTADDLSQHPVDQLIRRLIETRHAAAAEDIAAIRERMATASFSAAPTAVPRAYRDLTYQGRVLGYRAEAIFIHLVQRVVVERQWVEGTNAVQYLAHLRQAVRLPGGRLTVYRRRGGSLAAVINQTADIIPADRLGSGRQPNLIVIFSADRGILISGYQFSTLDAVSIPEDARWLT